MTTNAKLYVTVSLALGFGVLLTAFVDWLPSDVPRFLAYLAFVIGASALRVSVPGLLGSLAFNFLVLLIAVGDLTFPETLLIGLMGTLIESVWRPGTRLSPVQVFFNLANASVAVFATFSVYHSPKIQEYGLSSIGQHAAAALAYFLANTFPNAAVVSLGEGVSLVMTWRKSYFSSFPHFLIAAALAWGFHRFEQWVGWHTALLAVPLVYLMYRTYALYADRIEDSRDHAEELAALHMRTIEALALAIEAKDDTTGEHLKRVQVYALEIGRMLKLSKAELEALRAAAVLHDIGKLAVPEHIISKPGKLTPEEFEKMKIHPVVGAEILEHVKFPYPVVPIVRSHHEKWNGSGYPYGLRGEDIPVGARILAAVDALDALASDRQYRKALPLDEAMDKIVAESGRSFDPRIVDLLKQNYVELERKAKTQTASPDTVRLSTNLKIERGAAPAAGFEFTRPGLPAKLSEEQPVFLEAVAATRRQIETLFDSPMADASGPTRLDETLALFAVRLKGVIAFEAMALYLVREDKLVPEYVSGDNYKLFSSLRIPMGQGLSGWVAENKKPIVNGNPSVEPGYLNDPDVFSTLRSALAVPLEASNGVIGVLSLYHEGRDAFSKDDQRLLQAIAPKLALSIERASYRVMKDEAAGLDSVTGIPNWRNVLPRIEQEISRCQRLNAGLVVMVCSIDGISDIQRELGTQESNRVLRTVAALLRDTCGDFDFVARSGNNEFVLVLPGFQREGVSARLDKIRRMIAMAGSRELKAEVGEAYFPDDAAAPEELLAIADRRLFSSRVSVKPAAHGAAAGRPWVQ